MNDSLVQRGYATLLVPQFTLYAELKKGNRPFYGTVASPSHATRIFDCMARELSAHGESQTGVFGANMKIESANDGPVTLILDSDEI
jgi:D-tyrosyl-tRNA(Tyr) deacylase